MKTTRSLFDELLEQVLEMDGSNPQKISESVFENWEVNSILDRVNEDLQLGGFQKRAFPRRIGSDPTHGGDSPGIGSIRDGEFHTDPPELLAKSEESAHSHPGKKGQIEEVEDLASGIMDGGRHLFELWAVDYSSLIINDIDVDRGVFYRMVAEGYQDIFDDTEIEEWFYG